MAGGRQRNALMAGRIEGAPVRNPFSFVVAGDSGAWPDPTADGIFSQLLAQVSELDPPAVFFAQLGDFAGPGTADRHEHYLGFVAGLPVPDVCVVGNHELDDASGPASFARVHGPMNFSFAHGHTRFVALHSQPGVTGEVEVRAPTRPRGWRARARRTWPTWTARSRRRTSRTASATSPRRPCQGAWHPDASRRARCKETWRGLALLGRASRGHARCLAPDTAARVRARRRRA